MLKITHCPTCGRRRIARVRRAVTRTVGGQRRVVPNVEFYECPDCQERVYDPTAMRRLEAAGSRKTHLVS